MTTDRPDAPRPALDADAARFLDMYGSALAFPSDAASDPETMRRYLATERSRLSAPPGMNVLTQSERDVVTEDHWIMEGLWVRSYVAHRAASEPRRIVLLLHGGGWVSGSVDMYDTTCRLLAGTGDFVVFSVEYRLSPEHPYPTPLDDCDRALQWVRANAHDRFGGDPRRMALMGTSAGGNLAAALALRIRDRGTDEIALQVLLYPALDGSTSGASYSPEVNGLDYFITAEHMRWYWDQYRGNQQGLNDNPYFSPLAAEDLSGVAPALILSAEFDVLRDDSLRYHERLLEAGVKSELRHYPQIHGFLALFDAIAEAAPLVRELAAAAGATLDAQVADTAEPALPPAVDVASRVESGTLERLDALTRWDSSSIETIRATYAALPRTRKEPADGVAREDAVIPGTGGRPDVPVRWYRPRDSHDQLPGIVYFHGGAYIMGTLDENDDRLDQLVLTLGCAVVSVDYRLAPENPYPAALDDAETVWRAVNETPESSGIDPGRLVVAGASAGAGLATSLTLRIKERGFRQPRSQLLVYPMLDDREWPSVAALAGGPGHWGLWQLRCERQAWSAYLGDVEADPPPEAAPGRASAEELGGIPPTFIGVGDLDAYVDSNLHYAKTLIAAGVSTELHIYPGVIHGGYVSAPTTPETSRFLQDTHHALRRALWG